MFLILGATGSGKTLITKRLADAFSTSRDGNDFSFVEMPPTIPTVGTNLVTVSLNRRQDITVREVGGCMGPIWKNYLRDTTALMYVIDISNRLQVAASCIQMLQILTTNNLSTVPVLVILNKIDLPDKMTQSELESLFRLSDTMVHGCRNIHQVEVSACTGKGFGLIFKWLEQNSLVK